MKGWVKEAVNNMIAMCESEIEKVRIAHNAYDESYDRAKALSDEICHLQRRINARIPLSSISNSKKLRKLRALEARLQHLYNLEKRLMYENKELLKQAERNVQRCVARVEQFGYPITIPPHYRGRIVICDFYSAYETGEVKPMLQLRFDTVYKFGLREPVTIDLSEDQLAALAEMDPHANIVVIEIDQPVTLRDVTNETCVLSFEKDEKEYFIVSDNFDIQRNPDQREFLVCATDLRSRYLQMDDLQNLRFPLVILTQEGNRRHYRGTLHTYTITDNIREVLATIF